MTTFTAVTSRSAKVESLCAPYARRDVDSRYLGYFGCFNQGRYFEAHEVLEDLWLPIRRQPVGDFYKGLIQLAGAFVHWNKGRHQPAVALLKLADANLAKFPGHHEHLRVSDLRGRMARWRESLEAPVSTDGRPPAPRPQVNLDLNPPAIEQG